MRGKITQWQDDKGFGFIVSEDGDEKLFFHISTVKTQERRPKVGDVVLYESIRDAHGRLQAKAVVIEGIGSRERAERNTTPIHTKPPQKDAIDYVTMICLLGAVVGGILAFLQTANIKTVIPFGGGAIIAIIVLTRQKTPREKRFICARCKTVSFHDKRTIRAWNDGILKLYCSACHQRWLAEHPRQRQQAHAGGCLSIVVLLVIVAIMTYMGCLRGV